MNPLVVLVMSLLIVCAFIEGFKAGKFNAYREVADALMKLDSGAKL